jgi:hypothetical protein
VVMATLTDLNKNIFYFYRTSSASYPGLDSLVMVCCYNMLLFCLCLQYSMFLNESDGFKCFITVYLISSTSKFI